MNEFLKQQVIPLQLFVATIIVWRVPYVAYSDFPVCRVCPGALLEKSNILIFIYIYISFINPRECTSLIHMRHDIVKI